MCFDEYQKSFISSTVPLLSSSCPFSLLAIYFFITMMGENIDPKTGIATTACTSTPNQWVSKPVIVALVVEEGRNMTILCAESSW